MLGTVIIWASTVSASASATYLVGRVHGREAEHHDANARANAKIRAHGAEDDLTRRVNETADRMRLAELHGHPNAFCTERCYER